MSHKHAYEPEKDLQLFGGSCEGPEVILPTAQGLFLALCSGVTLVLFGEPYTAPEIKMESATC